MSDDGPDRPEIDALGAVVLLSECVGTAHEVVGPLAGGETGATEIRRADGERYVLKWSQDPNDQRSRREGARLAERLRVEAGWPSPVQELFDLDDALLIVQQFMPGTDVELISHALVDQVVELHRSRTALAPEPASSWGSDMVELLVEGGRGYCLHEPLRNHDARTRRVIERIEEIGRSSHPDELDGRDVVHADLHAGNILQRDGRLTAVVDMDYTRVGDAAFDLATLAVSSLGVGVEPGVRERLVELALDTLSDARRRVYVANLVLRNLDWSIRKQRGEELEFWLAQTEWLLPTT